MPSPVAGVSGLGAPEDWGRWANDTRIALYLDRALPPEFDLRLACAVAPVNVGRVSTVIVGSCIRRFVSNTTLARGLEVVELRMLAEPGTRILEILVPDADETASHDGRRLGFALSSMVIAARIGDAGANG